MAQLNEGSGPFPELAPNDPNARSAKPMNEASDMELLKFLHEDFSSRLLLTWVACEQAAKQVMANPTYAAEVESEDPVTKQKVLSRETRRMNPEQFQAALAAAWKGTLDMLLDLEGLRDHLSHRIQALRIRGIFSGDPREESALSISPNEVG